MTEAPEIPTEAGLNRKTGANPWFKLATEMGPLLLFFFANARPKLFEPFIAPFLPQSLLEGENAGLYTATVVLMAAVLVALLLSYLRLGRLPIMPVVTAVLVIVFGALSLYLRDPRFIKMKPTILYIAFGAALIGGMIVKKPLLPIILDNAMNLTSVGWQILTLRWIGFFFILAALNELVWRTQSNDVWVAFKFPGTVILIFLFTAAQIPLIMKYEVKDPQAEA